MKNLLLLSAFFSAFLLISGINSPPTGFLHSWNQITTLSTARGIKHDFGNFLKPQESVVRITWEPKGNLTVYEEFPLYHLATSILSNLTTLEISARIVSIFFFLISAWAFYEIVKPDPSAEISLFLFLSSYPFLYYGSAVMSDIAMIAFMLLATHFAKQQKIIPAYLAVAISGLCKSYGIISTPIVFILLFKRHKRAAIVGSILAIIPVFCWHLFAMTQPGHQEIVSHSLMNKIEILLTVDFYNALQKAYFKYLGYIPGVVLIVGLVARKLKANLWSSSWLFFGVVYLLSVSDKLIDHDYYFLIFFPPLFFIAGKALYLFEEYLFIEFGSKARVAFLVILLASNYTFAGKRVLKGKIPNPDVTMCAEAVRENTEPNKLIAILTDTIRYNSIAYYAERNGYFVEQKIFPIERYRDAGATALVVNLTPAERTNYNDFINSQSWVEPIYKEKDLKNFRNQERICEIYKLNDT